MKEKTMGIKLIGISEIIFGVWGIYVFYSGLRLIFGIYNSHGIAQEARLFRQFNVIQGGINVAWSLPYLGTLAAGIGLFKRKEWARRVSRWVMPLAIAVSVPLWIVFFIVVRLILEKLGLSWVDSRVLFITIQFCAFLLSLFLVIRSFVKYLNSPEVKQLFC